MLAGALPRLDPCRVLPIDGTADAQQAHARDALGLPRAMTRPVLHSALVSRLASARAVESSATVSQGLPASGRVAAHVLLVEDDTINQAVVKSMLEYAGFACTIASNGTSALQMLGHSPYDLVLMDWQMPDMDGLEATRRLRAGRAGELNRTVPVVALTANAFAEDRSACLAAGMNDFITKPVLASHLVAVAERWAFRDRVPDSTRQPLNKTAVRATVEDGVPVYDPGVMARLPMVADGSDPAYPLRLLRLFERTLGQTFGTIEQGIAAQDLKVVQRGVHSLKSSAGQVGALALAAEAARFEAALRRGELDVTEMPPRLQRLRMANQRVADTTASIASA